MGSWFLTSRYFCFLERKRREREIEDSIHFSVGFWADFPSACWWVFFIFFFFLVIWLLRFIFSVLWEFSMVSFASFLDDLLSRENGALEMSALSPSIFSYLSVHHFFLYISIDQIICSEENVELICRNRLVLVELQVLNFVMAQKLAAKITNASLTILEI